MIQSQGRSHNGASAAAHPHHHTINFASGRARPVPLLALMLAVAGLFFGAFVYSQQSGSPNPNFVAALWAANDKQLSKFASESGDSLLQISSGKFSALAIDATRGVIWASGGKSLRAYDFAGNTIVSVPVPSASDHDDSDSDSDDSDDDKRDSDDKNDSGSKNVYLEVHPADGSVWLAVKKTLFRFSVAGELITRTDLGDKVLGIGVDPARQQLWIATKRTVRALGASGTVIAQLPVPVKSEIRALAVNPESGDIWVARKEEIIRFGADLTPQASTVLRKVEYLAVFGSGAWAATNKRLLRIDDSGLVLFELFPFDGKGGVTALTTDSADGSAWIARNKEIRRIASDSTLLAEIRAVKKVRALAAYADVIAPELEFVSPADGSAINANRPTLALAFSDIGIGVDPQSLIVQADGSDLVVDCNFTASGADCQPAAALPEGPVTFSANVADFAGNLSVPANISLTIDTIAPVISLTTPSDGRVVSESEIRFVGSLSEVAQLALNGASIPIGLNNEFDHGPVALAEGPNAFVLIATDAAGNTSALSITVERSSNQAPIFTPLGNQTVSVGTTLNLNLAAVDPEGDAFIFGATTLPLPGNATLSAQTGSFRFRPTVAEVGVNTVNFFVSDGINVVPQSITITVPAPDPNAPTGFSGRLLDANDYKNGITTPVVGATISFLGTGISATSDSDGRFVLNNLPAGDQVFDINAGTANSAPDGKEYAGFREEVELQANVVNVIDRPFFLPRIADTSRTTVDPNTMTMVQNDALDVSLEIPPQTAKNPDGSNFTGELSISLVPEDLAPAPLPDTLDPALLITIQPVGVTFDTPVPITFPNIDNLPPGSEVDIWSLDAETGQFVIVGTGRVTANGQAIETISGGIRAADWHAALPPQNQGDPNERDRRDPDKEDCAEAGSVVALASGCLQTDCGAAACRQSFPTALRWAG